MKKLLIMLFFGLGAFALGLGKAYAGEPVWLQSEVNNYSGYTITQATMTISSETIKTIAAVQYYRNVEIDTTNLGLGATVYYTIDGSTTTAIVRGKGIPIIPGLNGTNTSGHARNGGVVFETNGVINMTLSAGQTSKDVIVTTKRKSR